MGIGAHILMTIDVVSYIASLINIILYDGELDCGLGRAALTITFSMLLFFCR